MPLYRPGPERVAPGLAPGGLVVHIYGEHGQRVAEQRLAGDVTDEDLDRLADVTAAATTAALAEGEACCVVTYDGDTGERVTPMGTGEYRPDA